MEGGHSRVRAKDGEGSRAYDTAPGQPYATLLGVGGLRTRKLDTLARVTHSDPALEVCDRVLALLYRMCMSNNQMKSVNTYATRLDADLARIALEAAGIQSIVVGVGVGMEGGADGVHLLVPDDQVEAALTALADA